MRTCGASSVRLARRHLAVVLQHSHQMVVVAGTCLLALALPLLALRHGQLLQPLVLPIRCKSSLVIKLTGYLPTLCNWYRYCFVIQKCFHCSVADPDPHLFLGSGCGSGSSLCFKIPYTKIFQQKIVKVIKFKF